MLKQWSSNQCRWRSRRVVSFQRANSDALAIWANDICSGTTTRVVRQSNQRLKIGRNKGERVPEQSQWKTQC